MDIRAADAILVVNSGSSSVTSRCLARQTTYRGSGRGLPSAAAPLPVLEGQAGPAWLDRDQGVAVPLRAALLETGSSLMYLKLISGVLAVAAAIASVHTTEARPTRRPTEPLALTVGPRSYLNPGKVVAPGAFDGPTSAYGQLRSHLASPPYIGMREQFGRSVLPDPITNGPFVGSRNPFGSLDFRAPDSPNR